MATEFAAIKLEPDTQLYLEQPFLRLPQELVARNFRTGQALIQRERNQILPALKDAANAALSSSSADSTLTSLDSMIARMQAMKRKLESLQQEEQEIQEHTAKRIKHLQDLYEIPGLTDVKYDDWSRTRLDRLLVDYLLRAGYSETAAALAKEKHIDDLVDLDVFVSCHRIAANLAKGDTKDALAWCTQNKAALLKPSTESLKHNLDFELRLQQFIELVRVGTTEKKIEAMLYAQKHLPPSQYLDQMMHPAGLLAAAPLARSPSAMSLTTNGETNGDTADGEANNHEPKESPYASLFSPTRWAFLSQLFVDTHHTLLNLPTRPLLHVALTAGLSALKTPSCHSTFNPASATSPQHPKIALADPLIPIHNGATLVNVPASSITNLANLTQMQQRDPSAPQLDLPHPPAIPTPTPTSTISNTLTHQPQPPSTTPMPPTNTPNLTINPSLCPICSTELNTLALRVPYAHHTRSHIDPDPVVLPSGRIYGRARLENYSAKLVHGGLLGEGTLKDPVTGEVWRWGDVGKVFIS